MSNTPTIKIEGTVTGRAATSGWNNSHVVEAAQLSDPEVFFLHDYDYAKAERNVFRALDRACHDNRAQDQPWHKKCRRPRIPQKPANAGFRP